MLLMMRFRMVCIMMMVVMRVMIVRTRHHATLQRKNETQGKNGF